MLAATSVMASPPDGYTLLVGAAGAMSIGPAVYTRMAYDTLKNFTPISVVGTFPLLLVVSSDGPARTATELVTYAKANPTKANYSSASPTFTLAAELFKLKTGAPLERITYRGSNDAVVAVLGGQVTATIVDPLPALPLIQDGKLRALAVTSKTRLPELPDVPTMAEAGVKDMVVTAWFGLVAPAGTPSEAIDKLYAATRDVVRSPEISERFRAMGGQAGGNTPAEFTAFIDQERARWKTIVDAAGLAQEQ